MDDFAQTFKTNELCLIFHSEEPETTRSRLDFETMAADAPNHPVIPT